MHLITPNRQVSKHFKVHQVLGQGSYATTYLVERREDGKLYALKQTNVQSLPLHVWRDVVNEARLLASLRHPHIVPYYEAFLDGDFLCVVLELLPGGDLASLIQAHKSRGRPIEEEVIWSYALQVGEGLRHLHSRNIMHRHNGSSADSWGQGDVKPHNVLVSSEGVVKLVDLGIAKLMRDPLTSTLIGTPHYMSPEIWERQPYSLGCDVWSLGCMLYEMAALRAPFEGNNVKQLRIQVLLGRLERIPARYSDDLWLLIRGMLTAQPHLRPDMDEIMDHYTVAGRRHLLPLAPARSLNEDLLGQEPSILETIQVPEDLAQLNRHLPPATYKVGRSVLEHILEGEEPAPAAAANPSMEKHQEAQEGAGAGLAAGKALPGHVRTSSFKVTAAAGPPFPAPAPPPAPTPVVEVEVGVSALGSPASSAPPTPCSPSPLASSASPSTSASPLSSPLAGPRELWAQDHPHRAAPLPCYRMARSSPSAAAMLASAPFVAALGAAFAPEPPTPAGEEPPHLVVQRPGGAPVKLHPKYAALVIRECSEDLLRGAAGSASCASSARAAGSAPGSAASSPARSPTSHGLRARPAAPTSRLGGAGGPRDSQGLDDSAAADCAGGFSTQNGSEYSAGSPGGHLTGSPAWALPPPSIPRLGPHPSPMLTPCSTMLPPPSPLDLEPLAAPPAAASGSCDSQPAPPSPSPPPSTISVPTPSPSRRAFLSGLFKQRRRASAAGGVPADRSSVPGDLTSCPSAPALVRLEPLPAIVSTGHAGGAAGAREPHAPFGEQRRRRRSLLGLFKRRSSAKEQSQGRE